MNNKAMRALLYAGDILGVDLGSYSVRILQLKAAPEGVLVHAFVEHEVWRELEDAASDEERLEIYSSALRQLLEGRHFTTANGAIALSGNLVLLRFLPLAADHAPSREVPSEAWDLIPFERGQAAVDGRVQDVSYDAQSPRREMVLAVAEEKTVEGVIEAARSAGLRPSAIISDSLALENAYDFFPPEASGETQVLVDIGHSTTSVNILEAGVLRASRVFNVAGRLFTKALRRDFDIDEAAAETLKREHGLLGGDGSDDAARVQRALRPIVAELGVAILRTLDSYLDKRAAGHPAPTRLLLSGGSAELKGLADALALQTGLRAKVYRPLHGAEVGQGCLGLDKDSPALAAAAGAAVTKLLRRRSGLRRNNLLPRRKQRAAVMWDLSVGFGPFFLSIMLACAGMIVFTTQTARVLREEREAAERLALAAARREALADRFAPKPVTPAAAKPARSPFAFLKELSVTGVFGDVVMLKGPSGVFVARSGQLFDEAESAVAGVSTALSPEGLILTTVRGEKFVAELPK